MVAIWQQYSSIAAVAVTYEWSQNLGRRDGRDAGDAAGITGAGDAGNAGDARDAEDGWDAKYVGDAGDAGDVEDEAECRGHRVRQGHRPMCLTPTCMSC